jgi:eukaryotic-like serine/threonine-protein kinase
VGPQQAQSSGTIAAGDVLTTKPPPGYQGHPGDTVTMIVSSGPAKVPVPDVTGKDQPTATGLLMQAGFRVTLGPKQSSVTVPAGSVVQTSPSAGTPTLQGTVVALDLSSGPAKVRVPYVINFTEANARADIQTRGLVVAETTEVVTSRSKDGVVLDQQPGAGVTVDQGTTVNLIIGQYQAATTSTLLGL